MTDIKFAQYEAKPTAAAVKAEKMRAALRLLQTEYANLGQRDRATLIGISLDALDGYSLAKLHDLIVTHDTPQEALDAIDPR